MTYEHAVEYIHSLRTFGSVLGLDRIQTLLERLGNPQEQLKIIHVAGTNGKGSTCSFLSSILQAQGYQVGLYTSPAILCFNERIQINRKNIDNNELAIFVDEVRRVIEQMQREGLPHPTEFEAVTAMAFLYFASKKVDFVILEVGLGGRYDATNVIQSPILTIITSISFDHMDILGQSLAEIAYEKGGIIKDNVPLALYPQQQEARVVIEKIAVEKKASICFLEDGLFIIKEIDIEETRFDFSYQDGCFPDLVIKMKGEHQVKNASLALLGSIILQQLGVQISKEAIYKGLEAAYWPARFEILSKHPWVILDGAHNAEGAAVLTNTLKPFLGKYNIKFLVGVLEDKQYEEMIKQLAIFAQEIIISEVSDNPRALSKQKLYEYAALYHQQVTLSSSLSETFFTLLETLEPNTVLCCTGSLYFVSEIKRLYEKEEGIL